MSHRARHLHHRLATFGAAALLAACALLPACGQQSAEDKVGAAEPASVRHSGEEGKMGKPSSRQKSGLYAMKGPRDGVPQHAHGDTKAEEREAEPSAPPPAMVAADESMKEKKVMMPVAEPAPDDATGEGYAKIEENAFLAVKDAPLSTFSIDVDTASYSNMRRFVNDGVLPPIDAVRVEEFINYFNYDYPNPEGADPFSITTEVAACPWQSTHRLVQIGIKGKEISAAQIPARNLVFLFDVSGSMNSPDKLPLLKAGMSLLVRDLRPQDNVAIVVYAGASGLVLPSTPGTQRSTILDALARLEAGGSTNGGQGIELAYAVASQNFKAKGINRVILATDGDFNVGTTDRAALERLIEDKRKSGVFLTVLGFGTGNVKDATMEMLADKGNGNYAYIDSIREAEKVLVREAGATLATVAKDVKIQVEFNPLQVAEYRLIGYENRALADRDFNDDTKDAGEIGAGHTVTALYEVIPPGVASAAGSVDPLKYQDKPATTDAASSGELMTVKLRYKQPEGDTSTLITRPVKDGDLGIDQTSDNFRLAAGVASMAMILRSSEYAGDATLDSARKLVNGALAQDPFGDRKELLVLIDKIKEIGIEGRARTRAP